MSATKVGEFKQGMGGNVAGLVSSRYWDSLCGFYCSLCADTLGGRSFRTASV